ncbi:MAG: hypothetical protein Q9160_006479 [Pyrenula sp. 1 TL-2023]
MSYPTPPGFSSKSSSSTPQPPSSLPPRPPPSSNAPPSSFKPAFSSGGYQNAAKPAPPSTTNAFTAFAPRSVASSNFRSTTSTPPNYSAPAVTNYSSGPQPSQTYQHDQSYYPNQQYGADQSFSIRNPFPLPGQEPSYSAFGGRDANVDPEMEAQIAEWQSAYVSKDTDSSKPGIRATTTGANTAPLGPSARTDTPSSSSNAKDNAPKTVVRSGGGQTWQDSSLLEWDPAHFRIFVGNLAGEVTDDSLLKAFSKYDSVQKARVIRDKRTTKSKGYGFVSFSDGDEFFRAARDMQGKYIGSHPVILRRSTTEIKATAQKDERKGGKYGKGGHGGGKGGLNGKVERGGIDKRPAKTKGGLKILG